MHKEENAQEYLNKLKPYLKEENPQNRQYFITEETLLLYYSKRISIDLAVERLKQAYQITKQAMAAKENIVLSRCETKILINLALLYKDRGEIEEAVELLLFLKDYYEHREYNLVQNKAIIIWANLANIFCLTWQNG